MKTRMALVLSVLLAVTGCGDEAGPGTGSPNNSGSDGGSSSGSGDGSTPPVTGSDSSTPPVTGSDSGTVGNDSGATPDGGGSACGTSCLVCSMGVCQDGEIFSDQCQEGCTTCFGADGPCADDAVSGATPCAADCQTCLLGNCLDDLLGGGGFPDGGFGDFDGGFALPDGGSGGGTCEPACADTEICFGGSCLAFPG